MRGFFLGVFSQLRGTPEVNDDAESLTPRSALRFFASRLAPTVPAAIGFVVWWCTCSPVGAAEGSGRVRTIF
ncbi:hypothetical protein C1X64_08485 [Pseudomonas sp. GW456-E7]|nr:hypothetical protein C1X64_08485 [Pseudomonas sp. GW456-E7]